MRNAAFQWVKEWFLEQSFLQHIRRVDLDTTLRGRELSLIPAPGSHWFRYQGRPFVVHFHRSEETKGRTQRRLESLAFQTIGRNQRVLRRFVEEVVACHHNKAESGSCLYVYDDYWSPVQAYAPRLLDSVILQGDEKNRLLADLEVFRSSRERYRRLGVPYHRGYLLYGPPGTGKTSLVSALAAHFSMSIYVLNLIEYNDRSLKTAMNQVPENSMILFEVIDAMRAGHRRSGSRTENDAEEPADGRAREASSLPGVTLAGLLNVLDGLYAPENVVFVMTTNDVSALDPALLRPGRIDYRLYMGQASEPQKVELYRRFRPHATESEARGFAQAHPAHTMAEFQGLLLRLMQVAGYELAWNGLRQTGQAGSSSMDYRDFASVECAEEVCAGESPETFDAHSCR